MRRGAEWPTQVLRWLGVLGVLWFWLMADSMVIGGYDDVYDYLE